MLHALIMSLCLLQCTDAVQIDGPARVKPYQIVEMAAKGDTEGKALIWDVTPEEAVDAREFNGRLYFIAPPGVYKVKLRAIKVQPDGSVTVETARTSVTIETSFDPKPIPPTPPNPTPPTPPDPDKPKPNPVQALAYIQFGNSGCTATVIYPRRADGRWNILTAAHCVPSMDAHGVMKMKDGRSVKVTVASIDRRCDVSWLITDDKIETLPYALLAADNPPVGTAVWHAGYGVDKPNNREDGTVKRSEDSNGQICYHLSVSSGDSGGGIFRSDTNEVVGTVCCTAGKGVKTDMWAGSAKQARRLMPK